MSSNSEIDALTSAVKRMPPKTRLSLLREASATQDMGWLVAAAANGLFDTPTTPRSDADQRHHPEEWVDLCSLASIVERRSLQTLKCDPYSGVEMKGGSDIYLSTVAVEPEFLQFFRTSVQNFASEASAVLRENLAVAAENRGGNGRDLHTLNVKYGRQATATAGVLMSAASAINDVQTVAAVDSVFPEAKLAACTAMFLPALKGHVLARPLASALAYGHRDAMEKLLDSGFDVEEPVAFRCTDLSQVASTGAKYQSPKDVPLSVPAFCTMLMSEGMGLFAPPSVFDRYFEILFAKPGGMSESTLQDLDALARVVCDKDDLESLLPVLHRHGILEISATDLAISAISKGKLHVMPYVIDKVSWADWASIDGATPARSMDTFLPILALKANGNTGASLDNDELGALAAFLTRKCIDAGQSEVLSVSDKPNNAMRVYVDFDLPECLLMSLEAGADPHACPNGLPSVKELCDDTGGMEKVLNSFLARKAAEEAVRLIDSELLAEVPKARP